MTDVNTPTGESATADAQAALDALEAQVRAHEAAQPQEPVKPQLTAAQHAKIKELADRYAARPDEYDMLKREIEAKTTDPVAQVRSEMQLELLKRDLIIDHPELTREEVNMLRGTAAEIKTQAEYLAKIKASMGAKPTGGNGQPQAATVPESNVTSQAPARVAPPPLPVPGASAHEPTIKDLAVAACEAWKSDRAAGLIPDG